MQVCRCAGVQVCRCAGVQVCRCAGGCATCWVSVLFGTVAFLFVGDCLSPKPYLIVLLSFFDKDVYGWVFEPVLL